MSLSLTGNSLRLLAGEAPAALERTQGSFPVHLSDVPGRFVYLSSDAGEQYDELRAYLESADRVDVARWAAEIEDRLRNPATLVSGASTRGGTAPAPAAGRRPPPAAGVEDWGGWTMC